VSERLKAPRDGALNEKLHGGRNAGRKRFQAHREKQTRHGKELHREERVGAACRIKGGKKRLREGPKRGPHQGGEKKKNFNLEEPQRTPLWRQLKKLKNQIIWVSTRKWLGKRRRLGSLQKREEHGH